MKKDKQAVNFRLPLSSKFSRFQGEVICDDTQKMALAKRE
jgi:hypothetical protein